MASNIWSAYKVTYLSRDQVSGLAMLSIIIFTDKLE